MLKILRKTLFLTALILLPFINLDAKTGILDKNKDLVDAVILGDYKIVKSDLDSGTGPDATRDIKSKKTGIMYAAENGDLEMIKLLVSHRADLNRRDSKGNTPLMYAVRNNRFGIAEMLIKNGARAGTGNRMGDTPLEIASRQGNMEILRLLLDNSGISAPGLALIEASRYGYTEIVKILLGKNPLVTMKGREGMTALSSAVLGGQYGAIELLLKARSDINMIQRYSKTPVMIAVENGDMEMVKFLVSKGADINRITRGNNSALFDAIDSNIFDMVELLVGLKVRIQVKDSNMETPFMHLAKMDVKPDIEIARLLLKNRADINSSNRLGKTALMLASEKGHLKIVKLLVESGADINSRDRRRNDAAYHAAASGEQEVLNYLLEKGAKQPDIRVSEKKQPAIVMDSPTRLFHRAAALSNLGIMKQMIDIGIDIDSKDESGSTPLIKAITSGVPEKRLIETVKYLLDNDADPDIPDNKGITPLSHAAEKDYYKIVKQLINSGADLKGTSIFFCAYKNSDIKFARYLAENKKFDLNAALFLTDNHKVTKILIDGGADVNTRNKDNLTPILYHSEQNSRWGFYKNTRLMEELIKAGADINAADSSGKTALDYAKKNRDQRFARFLTEKGAGKGK